jgi:hypothetical protein
MATDLRADVHGVDVFPDSDRPVYMRMEGDGYATVPADRFLEVLGTAVTDYGAALEAPKHLLAAEVLMSAAFEATDRARFLAYITALEILADRKPRSAVLDQVVDGAISDLEEVRDDLADDEYHSFRTGLVWLRQQSIGQAIRGLGKDLVGASIPGLAGEAPRDFLARCYQVRSTLVHDGGMSSDIDLRALGGPLRSIVRAILIGEMGKVD